MRRSPRRPPALPDLTAVDAAVDRVPFTGALVDGAHHDGVDLDDTGAPSGRADGVVLVECALTAAALDGASVRRSRVVDSRVDRLSAVAADLSGATWRDVEVTGSRLSAMGLSRADLVRVRWRGTRLDGVVLEDAALTDVVFEDCSLREADLSGARLTRVSFVGCDLDQVQWAGAVLDGVDLRGASVGTPRGLAGLAGAVIDPVQLVELGPAMAAHLGMVVAGS